MTYPVFIPITQGETLSFEARFVGEDVRSATPSVQNSVGIPDDSFVLSNPDVDTIGITSDVTANFSPGTHDLQLWLSWPGGPASEMALEVKVVVDEPL